MLQHRRERFHAFNTARIVRSALQHSQLIVGYPDEMQQLTFGESAGLLFPSKDAICLSELAAKDRPQQLVIVDGTWHHAKTMVRDIPALNDLPRYCLRPKEPGRYRIRREPTEHSLSTVEAVVEALKSLEPETDGLDQLLNAFEVMVDSQLAHPKVRHDRKKKQRSTLVQHIPACFNALDNVVVAYGEAQEGEVGAGRRACPPVSWVARRLNASFDSFSMLIDQGQPLSEKFLGHIEMDATAFANAATNDGFRAAWSDFLQPNDTVAVFSRGTARSLARVDEKLRPSILLKSIRFREGRAYGGLEEVLEGEGILPAAPCLPGRAGRRLENAIAIVYHLSSLLNAPRIETGWPCRKL